ncbi:MAG: hypothetical protein E7372_02655 [Clostridiales bacterium]|nr:hypothetical protein [Clostridiales bacterium]
MTKKEELDLFLERAQEFIDSKYILADIKIVGLLKAIACSETLMAIFKNCLTDYDREGAERKYLVKSPYLSADKGEFILPANSKELLAFTFTLLVDIDAKRVELSGFLNKYFYIDGSFASGYDAFINSMIRPFVKTVKTLMESVIEGKLQDPVEAFYELENKKAKQLADEEERLEKDKELAKKVYGENVKIIKEILLQDKQKIKAKKMGEEKSEEMLLVIDMLANAITSDDRDAIIYAFVAYKFMTKAHKILFFNRAKKVFKLLKGVLSGI